MGSNRVSEQYTNISYSTCVQCASGHPKKHMSYHRDSYMIRALFTTIFALYFDCLVCDHCSVYMKLARVMTWHFGIKTVGSVSGYPSAIMDDINYNEFKWIYFQFSFSLKFFV